MLGSITVPDEPAVIFPKSFLRPFTIMNVFGEPTKIVDINIDSLKAAFRQGSQNDHSDNETLNAADISTYHRRGFPGNV